MPREEIVEGLRLAVERGEPLNKAMMSFYNAGYVKEEIEAAARALQSPHFAETQDEKQLLKNQPAPKQIEVPKPVPAPPKPIATPKPTPPPKPIYIPVVIPSPTQRQTVVQKVSEYEDKPKPLSAVLIFALVFVLLVLLGLLIAVFLFKDELTTLFNRVF